MAERSRVLETGSPADVRARLAAVGGFVIDLDGTLALGDSRGQGLVPIKGALEFVERLNKAGAPYTASHGRALGRRFRPHPIIDNLGELLDAARSGSAR